MLSNIIDMGCLTFVTALVCRRWRELTIRKISTYAICNTFTEACSDETCLKMLQWSISMKFLAPRYTRHIMAVAAGVRGWILTLQKIQAERRFEWKSVKLFSNLARYQQIAILDWIKSLDFKTLRKYDKKMTQQAASGNCIQTLDWLLINDLLHCESVFYFATSSDVLRWAHIARINVNMATIKKATILYAKYGLLDCLKYIFISENVNIDVPLLVWDKCILSAAAENKVDILKYMFDVLEHRFFLPAFVDKVIRRAIKCSSLDVLWWMSKLDCFVLDVRKAVGLALDRHKLTSLKWLHAYDPEYFKSTKASKHYDTAIRCGNTVDFLLFLEKAGTLVDVHLIKSKIVRPDYECIKWAVDRCGPVVVSYLACEAAIRNNDLKLVKWLVEYVGIQDTESKFVMLACESKNIEMIKVMHQHGFEWNYHAHRHAIINSGVVLPYLFNNGHPVQSSDIIQNAQGADNWHYIPISHLQWVIYQTTEGEVPDNPKLVNLMDCRGNSINVMKWLYRTNKLTLSELKNVMLRCKDEAARNQFNRWFTKVSLHRIYFKGSPVFKKKKRHSTWHTAFVVHKMN